MTNRTVGGALDQAALARLHFYSLSREQQEQAIRRLAQEGLGEHDLARATALSIEQIRRILTPSAAGEATSE